MNNENWLQDGLVCAKNKLRYVPKVVLNWGRWAAVAVLLKDLWVLQLKRPFSSGNPRFMGGTLRFTTGKLRISSGKLRFAASRLCFTSRRQRFGVEKKSSRSMRVSFTGPALCLHCNFPQLQIRCSNFIYVWTFLSCVIWRYSFLFLLQLVLVFLSDF